MLAPSHGVDDDPDAGIRSTDTDASLARLSAVKKGYLEDPYVHLFVPRAQFQQARTPLINIGTAIRSESLDRLILSWISICDSMGKKGQIVSMGAGNDTRFWRFADKGHTEKLAKYIELDFPEITSKKVLTIRKKTELFVPLGEPVLIGGRSCLLSCVYNAVFGDLRQPAQSLGQLTEAYMEPSQSTDVISWFTNRFSGSAPLGVVVYEMFGLNDRFGQVMKTNLQSARNIQLPGVEPFQDKQALTARFTDLGFQISRANTLKEIRMNILPEKGQSLLEKEWMDEVEELDLVLDHYAISWAQMWPRESAKDEGPCPWESWDLKWDT